MSHEAELNEALMNAAAANNCPEIEKLLKQGVNADGEAGLPLIWAAYYGHLEAASLLLKAGANPAFKDNSGKTAQHYAQKGGFTAVAELLQAHEFPNQVVLPRQLGNAFMEEVYDFERLERVTVLYANNGQPASFERETFAEVEEKNETVLRKAFNEHVKRGGKTAEETVFPAAKKLDKTGPSL